MQRTHGRNECDALAFPSRRQHRLADLLFGGQMLHLVLLGDKGHCSLDLRQDVLREMGEVALCGELA